MGKNQCVERSQFSSGEVPLTEQTQGRRLALVLCRCMSLLAAAALGGWLCACSTPYATPSFATNQGNDVSFGGVAAKLTAGSALDIVLVHGMCTHDGTWATQAVASLYSALGGDPSAVQLAPANVPNSPIILYQQTLPVRDANLRVNAVVWSPVTTPLKAALCYDQTNKPATCPATEAQKSYPYKRASLNRILKDQILDDCLSDAVIYQGRARDEINKQMQTALLQAVATSGGSRLPGPSEAASLAERAARQPAGLPLIFVTESLGSKVTFDALYKLLQTASGREAATRTLQRTTQVFMAANQMPILALADTTPDGTLEAAPAGYPADALGAAFRAISPAGLESTSQHVPDVIAFTDPSDVLSYILAPSRHAQQAGYRVVDVIVSNDTTYLGLVELPNNAHLGYLSNPVVKKLIVCGHTNQSCP